MTEISLVTAVTNGFRAWGAASLLLALPVIVPFIWRASAGAAMQAWFSYGVTEPRAWNLIGGFFTGLWREGWQSKVRVNVWLAIGLLLFLGGAGSGIFVTINFSPDGLRDQRLADAMLAMWALLSSCGWGFTISTARHPLGMAFASMTLLMCMMGLSVQVAYG